MPILNDFKFLRGRGIAKGNPVRFNCICTRTYCHILCRNCGHLMHGRVKYSCPDHPHIMFLIDITNCPKCKAFGHMLEEFENLEPSIGL